MAGKACFVFCEEQKGADPRGEIQRQFVLGVKRGVRFYFRSNFFSLLFQFFLGVLSFSSDTNRFLSAEWLARAGKKIQRQQAHRDAEETADAGGPGSIFRRRKRKRNRFLCSLSGLKFKKTSAMWEPILCEKTRFRREGVLIKRSCLWFFWGARMRPVIHYLLS